MLEILLTCPDIWQKISEDDEKAFQFFMVKEAPARRTLADIILEKLAEKKGEIDLELADDKSEFIISLGSDRNLNVRL